MARFINITKQTEEQSIWGSVSEVIVFYFDKEFIILRLNPTNDKLDMLEKFFNSLKAKKQNVIDIERSYIFDRDLQKFRLRGEKLQEHHTEVNYIYQGFQKLHCFITKYNFQEKWLSNHNQELEKDYLDAKEILNQYGYDYLQEDLKQLYENNIIHDCTTNIEHFRTIEHLTKNLKTKRNETSKH